MCACRSAPSVATAAATAYAQALFAFWDGKSRGTKNMIDEARSVDLPTIVIMLVE